jgi:hypothetical protein
LNSLPDPEEGSPPQRKRNALDSEGKLKVAVESLDEEHKTRFINQIDLKEYFDAFLTNKEITFEGENVTPASAVKILTLIALPNCRDVFVVSFSILNILVGF